MRCDDCVRASLALFLDFDHLNIPEGGEDASDEVVRRWERAA